MKKLILLALAVLSIIAILFFSGCDLSAPNLEGMNPHCKVFLQCAYLNQKNPDKSLCLSLADGCKQANDFYLCTESKMDFRDCLLLLKK